MCSRLWKCKFLRLLCNSDQRPVHWLFFSFCWSLFATKTFLRSFDDFVSQWLHLPAFDASKSIHVLRSNERRILSKWDPTLCPGGRGTPAALHFFVPFVSQWPRMSANSRRIPLLSQCVQIGPGGSGGSASRFYYQSLLFERRSACILHRKHPAAVLRPKDGQLSFWLHVPTVDFARFFNLLHKWTGSHGIGLSFRVHWVPSDWLAVDPGMQLWAANVSPGLCLLSFGLRSNAFALLRNFRTTAKNSLSIGSGAFDDRRRRSPDLSTNSFQQLLERIQMHVQWSNG